MENEREMCEKLANRIYDLDARVYKASGSVLGRTLSGSQEHNIEDLVILLSLQHNLFLALFFPPFLFLCTRNSHTKVL